MLIYVIIHKENRDKDKEWNMNKEETLQTIRDARDAHISQMNKIEALLNGEEVENPTAVACTECAFGLWLYNKNNRVEAIIGEQFYRQIELLHTKWHGEYSRIFDIFFKNRKKGFFAKVLGLSKIEEKEFDKAKLYYSELKETTEELLRILGSSQRRISALNESKFF